MNAESDTSTVVADGADGCVSPGLKVKVCICLYACICALGYCEEYV